MQDVIEELVRWFGYIVLRLVTFGQYRGGGNSDHLREGAVGLGLLVVVAYVTYSFGSR